MIYSQNYYTDLFKVSPAQMKLLIETALSTGSNYADLYFENTSYETLMLRDGEVCSGGFHVDYGVGIRALYGDKTGYAYSESTEMADMMSAAKAASSISRGVCRIEESKTFPGKPNPAADRYPILQDWRTSELKDFIPMLHSLGEKISSKDSRAIKIMAMLSSKTTDVMMFNSFGELKYETRPLASLSVNVVFSNGSEVETKSVSKSYRMGAEMMTEELVEKIASEAVKGIDERFEAKRPKGGKMTVVMGAGASGILLHEAMGHAFEADFNRKNQSVFSDKMGQRICPSGINIVDDATLRGLGGTLNFDDEGVPGQRTMMVEDGILTSYLHDRISAAYYHVSPTGNGRRESFRYNPIPRMRSTYMESGNADPQSIIASVKNGIYVDNFSNGQVKIGEGDFTFFVKSGFLIEDGRLTMPVKDINVMGNGPEALANIEAVGNDGYVDESAWVCGKEQQVPVSCGIPTVMVQGLTVGGE